MQFQPTEVNKDLRTDEYLDLVALTGLDTTLSHPLTTYTKAVHTTSPKNDYDLNQNQRRPTSKSKTTSPKNEDDLTQNKDNLTQNVKMTSP